ncbi:cystathionine gamma-synthase [Lentisalinibacter sediminis]|uniref:cystathionine gamma-synthase n=1 Tax=Lentisalinibacter sediminis TaxID=2992237 RepID=UPI00386B6DB3
MTQGPQSATQAVRAALESDAQYGAVVPPLHLSSNYTFEGFGRPRQYDYTRSGNPTRDALGRALSELEGGAGAVVTGSGMSAITLVCQLLKPGDLLIAPHDCYGGSFRLFRNLADRGAFDLEFVDQTDVRALEDACSRGPRLIWVETPSNPLLRITDINRVVALAKDCGALVAVDNTFLSPALQQPLALGADLVVHSTTKYLNGHSDVVGGAVVAGDEALASELADWANCIGITGAPFDSYLTLRGVRTLFARMRQHEENAAALADFLAGHEQVARVYYPGLESHPGHLIAARQQSGFGGMVSFELRGGIEDARRIADGLVHFSLAESLGGVESLVCHPATMTHAPMTPEARTAAGISDSLVRLSVGIESTTDLLGDLARALDGLGARGDLRAVAG